MTTVAERYLRAISVFDWDQAALCLSEDVTRVGPFGDTYQGRDAYLGFLSKLMPTLVDYRMDVGRVLTVDGGQVLVAELSESMMYDGKPVHTPECLVFELDRDGLIRRIVIYIQK